MSGEIEGAQLGPQFAGYIFKIMGGNDKQGFPMKQGVLLNKRTRLLLGKGNLFFCKHFFFLQKKFLRLV